MKLKTQLIGPLLALGFCVLMAGCDSNQTATTADAGSALLGAPQGPVVAVVNGEAVTHPVFEVYARGRGLDPQQPEQRQQAMDGLVENIVLAQAALAGPSDRQEELRAMATLARVQQLAGRHIETLRADITIPEQALRDYYQREIERSGTVEYRAQHLLFADAAAATEALAEALTPGADFEALMVAYEGRAVQARDLGWANLAQTPQEFAEVLPQLEDGEVAPVVVQTRFGHHVLRRAASRAFVPPPFEQVREGLQAQMSNQALAERVRALRETASISAPGLRPAGTQ
jgi:peptidyl-prolyl cis-trans isomerase C